MILFSMAFGIPNLVVAGYSDANWAGNADDRKSTSGGYFYVGNNLVAWMSRNESSISLSTAEAEYIIAVLYPIAVDEKTVM
jgi:hypothetical protein